MKRPTDDTIETIILFTTAVGVLILLFLKHA
jgi:hypothetical protein